MNRSLGSGSSGTFGNLSNSASDIFAQRLLPRHLNHLFAIDLGAIFGFLALFTNLLALEEKSLVLPELLGHYRSKRNVEAFVAGAFFVSALPFFWTPTPLLGAVRFYFWLAPFVARRGLWLLRRGR